VSKLSPVSRDDLIKKLRIFGFEGPCLGGKYQYMVKNNLRLTIPNPHKEEISADLQESLNRPKYQKTNG